MNVLGINDGHTATVALMKDCNLYWDFIESISGVLTKLNEIHTGNIQDYLMWYVIISSILLIIMVVV